MSSIVCKDLCKTFRQREEIITGLDNISLTIEEGDFVCLSGPSGSGKTTLLNAIGGLDTPDSGEITIADILINKLGKGAMADMRLHKIGFVFQSYNLIPVLSARENVEFIMQVSGMPAAERSIKSYKILQEVGLEGMEERRPAQLSGGQLMDLFTELNQQQHVTFVIATHDVRIMKYAKRLIKMEDGKIISDQIQ